MGMTFSARAARGQYNPRMATYGQRRLTFLLSVHVIGISAAAPLFNNAAVEASLPFICDEGFHEERSSLDGTHLCRSNDNTGHWHCPAGYVRVTRAPYCRLLLLRGSGGGGGGHRHGQQGATVPPADATLGESATTIATAATAATPITAANSVRAARARSVLAGGRGSAASEAFSTAAPKAPAAGAPAGAVEGLASEPCTMHTYFGSKAERPEDHAGNVATLASWRRGWEGRGWRTRVITEVEAAAHPQYASLRATFRRLPTVNSAEYELACFIRHLAMAAVGGGWMSDYDVVPLALPACAPLSFNGGFTTHQGFVPSLVSGTAAEYLRVTRLMAAVPYQAHNALFKHRTSGLPHVSDMRALQYLSASQQIHVWPPRSYNPSCGVAEAHLVFSLANGPNCPTSRSSNGSPTPIGAPTVDCPDHDARVSGSVDRSRIAMRAAMRAAARNSLDLIEKSSDKSGGGSGATTSATSLVGPLGAHLSHTSMTAFSSGPPTSSPPQALSAAARARGQTFGDWLPAPLLRAVQESGPGARQRSNFHQTRGALLELMPSAYANACSAPAKPRRLTAVSQYDNHGDNAKEKLENGIYFDGIQEEPTQRRSSTTVSSSSSSPSHYRHRRRRVLQYPYSDEIPGNSDKEGGREDHSQRSASQEEDEDEAELRLQARLFHRRRRRRRGGGGGSMSNEESSSSGGGGGGGGSVLSRRSRGDSSSSSSSGSSRAGFVTSGNRHHHKQANETMLAAMLREKPTSAFAQAAAQRWASKGEGRSSVASVQAKNDAAASKPKPVGSSKSSRSSSPAS